MSAAQVQDTRDAAIAQSGWGLPVSLWQPHNPAFWVYAWLVINGAYLYVVELSGYRVDASTIFISIVLQGLFALPFLWFITRTDRFEREPAKLAALGFLWGGLVSTWIIAAPANGHVLSLWAKAVSVEFASDWGPALTAPFTEETAKMTGVIMCVLLARQHVRSVYDGMLLGMFVGLGFQVFENVQYMVIAVEGNFNSAPLQDLLQIFVFRGATGVWGHWLFTGIAGAGVGYYVGATDKSRAQRVLVALGFLGFSMFCHGVFDTVGAVGYLAFAFVVPAMTIGGIVAWKFADGRARHWVRNLLQDEVASGVVTEKELDVLAGPHKARGQYIKQIRRADGKAAAKRAAYVLDAQTDLAAAIAATDNPSSPAAEAARAEVARLRDLPLPG